eukprot:15469220-Alexandrium_andersonii.AAC.1
MGRTTWGGSKDGPPAYGRGAPDARMPARTRSRRHRPALRFVSRRSSGLLPPVVVARTGWDSGRP